MCGSAFKNKGVQPLLDAVVRYLPAPVDVPPIEGVTPKTAEAAAAEKREYTEDELRYREADDAAPFAALAFKIMTNKYFGQLTYARVYSGVLTSGEKIYNATKDKSERVGRILEMHANKTEDVAEVRAGDIVALVGMRTTTTGDTLCDPSKPIVLESIVFPEPVIRIAIEPRTTADQSRLAESLQKLAVEDPSFLVNESEESGQTIISGQGELHLEIIVDRLLREFKVEAAVGKPQVAYRETALGEAAHSEVFEKQAGGKRMFAEVELRVRAAERGAGVSFTEEIKGEAIPREFFGGIEKGVREACESGVLGGFPVVDLEVVLTGGTFHEVDSSEIAFKICASMGLRRAVLAAKPAILEPLMRVEVVTPEDFMGEVIGDVNSRRGQVIGMDSRGSAQVIDALVPLREMFGYSTDLRSRTQGRASYSMQFERYEPLPSSLAAEMI